MSRTKIAIVLIVVAVVAFGIGIAPSIDLGNIADHAAKLFWCVVNHG